MNAPITPTTTTTTANAPVSIPAEKADALETLFPIRTPHIGPASK